MVSTEIGPRNENTDIPQYTIDAHVITIPTNSNVFVDHNRRVTNLAGEPPIVGYILPHEDFPQAEAFLTRRTMFTYTTEIKHCNYLSIFA